MTSTRDRRFQFSVRSLLLALACCSLVFAVLPVLGVVAGSTAALMLAAYLVMRRLSLRWQIRSLICFLLFALPPHFGIPGYYFGPNIGQLKPPRFDYIGHYEILLPIAWLLKVLYAVAELPLLPLTISDEWAGYACFSRSSRIRPFAVWTFWLQMAAVAVLAIFASQIERRRSRFRNPLGRAEQTNLLPGDHGLQNQVGSQVAAEPVGLAAR